MCVFDMACAGTCECDYLSFSFRPIILIMATMAGYGLLLLSVCAKFAGKRHVISVAFVTRICFEYF